MADGLCVRMIGVAASASSSSLELDRQDGLLLRQRHEVDLRGGNHRERPLGADDDLREVERASSRPRTRRGCSRRRGGHLGIPLLDFVRAFARAILANRRDSTSPRACRPGTRASSSARSSGRKCDLRAVRQHDVELEHVIDRLAVQHRPRAAGVVADHAADGGAARRGDVRREAQPVLLQLRVQLVEHDARLDDRPALRRRSARGCRLRVARRVELQAVADRLPGLRRAAAPRRDRARRAPARG